MHTVEAPVSAGSFDVGITSWMSHEALDGGQAFGAWFGVNSPRSQEQTFTSGGAIGMEVNVGNRWGDDGYQNFPAEKPRWTTGINVVPDVVPSYGEGPPQSVHPGSFGVNVSKSIHGHKWWVGLLMNWNSIMTGGHAFNIFGGGAADQRPQKIMHTGGYWVDGIDFSPSDFSGAALSFSSGQASTSATAGTRTLPSRPAGFLKFKVAGQIVKVPYYKD